MSTKRQQSQSDKFTQVRPPAWFRYGIMAVATLILCSCRATTSPVATSSSPQTRNAPSRIPLNHATTASFNSSETNHQVIPAIYQEDPHSPLPAFQQTQYEARIQPEGCQSCEQTAAGSTAGPRDEYLCDGGDYGLSAAVRKDWHIDGLEQEDTVAHYDTVDGRTVVTPSNRVCIYAPRFGVVRRVVDLHEYSRYEMPSGANDTLALAKIDENEKAATSLSTLEPTINRAEAPPSLLRERQQAGELDRDLRLAEFDGTLAPYANLQIIRIGTVSNDERALMARASLAAITWTGNQAPQITIDKRRAQAAVGQKQAGVVYHQEDPTKPRLRLVKLASTGSAKPGEEIEFTLRFDNIGSQVMGNVTIVDHLTARLEYVPDSAKASVEADFRLQPGSDGSAVLRWEITEPLEAGDGGILQFKCKVL